MKLNEYLQRIQLNKQSAPNVSNLQKLILHHLYHIPIENVDVMRRNRIWLEIDHLYHKIILMERGGLSYELNALFSRLLKEMGYTSYLVSGRFPVSETEFVSEFDHMAIVVQLDKAYLVDVGYEEHIRSPLPLTGEITTDISGTYRIVNDPTEQLLYRVQKRTNGLWFTLYSFENTSQELLHFQDRCLYHQSSLLSKYTHKTMASKATVTGSISLEGDKLITVRNGIEEVKEIASLKEQLYLLHHHFGISHSSILQKNEQGEII